MTKSGRPVRWPLRPLPRSCAMDVRGPHRRPPQPAHSPSVHLGAEERGSGELQANNPRSSQDSDAGDGPNFALFQVRFRGFARRLRFAVIFDGVALSSLWKESSAVALRIRRHPSASYPSRGGTCDRG